ncbi:MAG: helix-turn-helix domain-containing protein [Clostridia bacterium]|nr:helix-turn-helix domain-containing protein [Clostridia bacterium]
MQIFDPRQSMSKSDFEIFHYRDAKFSGVPVHQHDFYEIYLFISGKVEYSVEGKIFEMKKGDLLLISPLELHQPRISENQEDYERIVLWINKDFLFSLSSNDSSLSRCFDSTNPHHSNLLRLSFASQELLKSLLTELIKEQSADSYANDLACKAILLRILVELNRLSLSYGERHDKENSFSPLILSVLDYINHHYCEKLSLSSIADDFFVSKYYLSHAFNSVVGTSVHRYITLKRLIHAKQMLSSGIKPTTVASNCGFGDYAGFYRAFTGEYGITPAEYSKSKS